MDCSNAELFEALTHRSRMSAVFNAGAVEDELRRFVGTLEYNNHASFDEACITARALIIQETYLDMAEGKPNSLRWQFAACTIMDQIKADGSDLEDFMHPEREPEAELRFSIHRALEEYQLKAA